MDIRPAMTQLNIPRPMIILPLRRNQRALIGQASQSVHKQQNAARRTARRARILTDIPQVLQRHPQTCRATSKYITTRMISSPCARRRMYKLYIPIPLRTSISLAEYRHGYEITIFYDERVDATMMRFSRNSRQVADRSNTSWNYRAKRFH